MASPFTGALCIAVFFGDWLEWPPPKWRLPISYFLVQLTVPLDVMCLNQPKAFSHMKNSDFRTVKCRSVEHHFPSVLIFPSCIWNSLSLARSSPASCFQVELQCSPLLFHWPWHPLLPNNAFNALRDLRLRIVFMLWLSAFLPTSFHSPLLVSVPDGLRPSVPTDDVEGNRSSVSSYVEPWWVTDFTAEIKKCPWPSSHGQCTPFW